MSTDAGLMVPARETQLAKKIEPELLRQIRDAISRNVDATERRISRLAILQSKSPEIDDKVQGYEEGMLIDNQTREVLSTYGKPPWLLDKNIPEANLQPIHYLPFVSVFKLPTEFIKWIKKEEREEYRRTHPGHTDDWEFKTLDRNEPRVKAGIWESLGGSYKGKKPPVTDNGNFLILPLDLVEKIAKSYFTVATFSRTSAKTGHTLTNWMETSGMQDIQPWERVYYLWTKKEKFTDGSAYTLQLAKGPKTAGFLSQGVLDHIQMMALALSNEEVAEGQKETNGERFQKIIINSASQPKDELSSGNTEGGPDGSEEEDPFAPKP